MESDPPGIHRFAHEAMSTVFEFVASGVEKSYAAQAAQAVFSAIDRMERLLSRFDPSSDIGRINSLDPGESTLITRETFECLVLAERFRRKTAGAFDVGVRSLLEYGVGSGTGPAARNGNADTRKVVLSRVPGGYEASVPGNAPGKPVLDLGGIGKGYALDRVRDILVDWEMENVLIHGGTSTVLALGSAGPEEQGWPVGLAGPWDCPGIPKRIVLRNRALSGSGVEVKGDHVIDPRTGRLAEGHIAAWVSHASAAAADALSTAFMVMDTGETARFCGNHGSTGALVVDPDGGCRVFNSGVLGMDFDRMEDQT